MNLLVRRISALTLPVVAAALLAACGSDDSSSTSTSASTGAGTTAAPAATATTAAASCTKDSLSLVNDGQLTIGTDKPAYPPYFEDDDPTNGKGFESAVAYAIAKQLGFATTDVKWTVVPFNSSYAPGEKKFDFDVNQISITPARAKRVDFSKPYYTAPQAVVALKGTSAADATTLAQLQDAQLGVQIGTTSLDVANEVIKPSQQAKVFNDSNDVVAALKGKQVDAVVVDLPTAFYLTSAELDNAKIVGQFQAPGGDTWGAVLGQDSELTACVDQAITELDASGELAKITQQWMGSAAGAPTLK
jgi:polar amino acid transport system substrate-binding protein